MGFRVLCPPGCYLTVTSREGRGDPFSPIPQLLWAQPRHHVMEHHSQSLETTQDTPANSLPPLCHGACLSLHPPITLPGPCCCCLGPVTQLQNAETIRARVIPQIPLKAHHGPFQMGILLAGGLVFSPSQPDSVPFWGAPLYQENFVPLLSLSPVFSCNLIRKAKWRQTVFSPCLQLGKLQLGNFPLLVNNIGPSRPLVREQWPEVETGLGCLCFTTCHEPLADQLNFFLIIQIIRHI